MALTSPVSDLANSRVPLEELLHPEYCFKIAVEFRKKSKDDPGIYNLSQTITALLNTSGGIIFIENYPVDGLSDLIVDRWKIGLREHLKTFIPQDVYLSCINLAYDAKKMQILVKRSPTLVTLKSYMHIRTLAITETLDDVQSIHNVMHRSSELPKPNVLDGFKSYEYMSPINIHEGQTVEFKYWASTNNLQGYKRKLTEERTRKCFFALSNMRAGGDVLIGVQEEEQSGMNVVKGQVISEKDEEQFVKFLTEMLEGKGSHPHRIWGGENGKPSFHVTFIPINNVTDGSRKRLIRVHMDHCLGGVMEKHPESYIVSEDGHVEVMSFRYWKHALSKCMTQTFPHVPDQSTTSSDRLGETELKRKRDSEQKKLHASTSATPTDAIHDLMKDDIKKRDFLSWTLDRRCWYKNVSETTLEKEKQISTFVKDCAILKPSDPPNYTPDKSTILSHFQNHEHFQSALALFENHLDANEKCCVIVSSSWTSNIQNTVGVKRPTKQLLDLFSFNESCAVTLWCILRKDATKRDVQTAHQYVMESARLTKRKLLFDQDSRDHLFMQTLSINCHIHRLGDEMADLDIEMFRTGLSYFDATSSSLESLKQNLAELLLEKETLVKDSIGNERQIFLTAQQMEKVLSIVMSRFNFLQGPPGCGKTYIAMHLRTRYQNPSIGYICTTFPFKQFLEFQGFQNAILARNEDELNEHIENGHFNNLECVIIDDVQNLKCSLETWLKLFEYVRCHPSIHLFLFADSEYQNFKSTSNVREVKGCLANFCDDYYLGHLILRMEPIIHRNEKKVVSFIKSCFEDSGIEHLKIAQSKKEYGDDIEVRYLENIRINSRSNGLVAFLQSVVGPTQAFYQSTTLYDARDVVILVDTTNTDADVETLRKIDFSLYNNHIKHVHDASEFPVCGLTIDTLDNFTGLDRKVCILITSSGVEESSISRRNRTLGNPKYKTFVASRAISRVVFVIDRHLDASLAEDMKMNKLFPTAVKKFHMTKDNETRDLCFVKAVDVVGIFYITFGENTEYKSLDGDELILPINTSEMKLPRCASSSPDHTALVFVDCDDACIGPWRWSVYEQTSSGLQKQHTNSVDGWPWSVCWTTDADIVMVIKTQSEFVLRRYHPNGELLWSRDQSVTKMVNPRRIAASPCRIFVADYVVHCIRTFTLHGLPTHVIPAVADPEMFQMAHGICVNASGHWLFVSHFNRYSNKWLVSMVSTDGRHSKTLKCIQTKKRIWSLQLLEDRYLAVGAEEGLFLFDVQSYF